MMWFVGQCHLHRKKLANLISCHFQSQIFHFFSKKETLNPIIIFHCTGLEELWLWRVCFLYYDSEIVLSCFPCKNWCQYWAECKILTWIYACHHPRIFKFFGLSMTSAWMTVMFYGIPIISSIDDAPGNFIELIEFRFE